MSTRTALAEAFYRIETLSAAGVTGLNGATGGVNLTSTDSSVTITPDTAAKTVNLSVSATSFSVKATTFSAGGTDWETSVNALLSTRPRTLVLIDPVSSSVVYSSTVFDNVASDAPFSSMFIHNVSSISGGETLELQTSTGRSIVTINPGEIVTLIAKGGINSNQWDYLPGVVLATDMTV